MRKIFIILGIVIVVLGITSFISREKKDKKVQSENCIEPVKDWRILKAEIDIQLGTKYVLVTPVLMDKINQCAKLYLEEQERKGPSLNESAMNQPIGWCWKYYCTRNNCSSGGEISDGCGWSHECGVALIPLYCWPGQCGGCFGCCQLFVGNRSYCTPVQE